MRVSIGRIPRRLPQVLRVLVGAAGVLIALGLVLGAHPDPLRDPARVSVPWAEFAPGGGGLPAAILDLGVLVLILSPAVVLAMLLGSFLRWKDRQMAVLSATVLAVLVLALLLGTR